MASPFPGMDPYLEDPVLWPGVHQRLITYTADQLQPQLHPRYVAIVEERVYLSEPEGSFYPDVSVVRRPPTGPKLLAPPDSGGGVAVAERVDTLALDEPIWIEAFSTEVCEAYLEIRAARGGEVITVIEFLSPANKVPGEGRRRYFQRQKQVLRSRSNLVEIDLLRAGQSVVTLPAAKRRELGHYDYLACIRYAAWPGRRGVYAWTVRDRLPRMAIPLRADEPPVGLDLPALLTQTYERGDYELWIDYTAEPDPSLSAADAAWADALLRDHGLRPGRQASAEA